MTPPRRAPYPASIYLTNANLLGRLEKVTLTVSNVSHPYAPDVGLLLVGPNGKSGVDERFGQATRVAALLSKKPLTFSDDAASSLPVGAPLVSGVPTSRRTTPKLSFPAPAPTAGYAASLGAGFAASNPNGVWSLYVVDDLAGPFSSTTPVIGSWTLNLYTTPLVSTETNTVYLAENGSAATVNFTVRDSSPPAGGFVASAGNNATNLVSAVATVSGTNGTLTITPLLNTFGTNTLTLTVSDGVGTVQTDVAVKLAHVNQAPTLTVTNSTLSTVAGVLSPVVNVVVGDVDPLDTPNTLNLVVTSSDTNIVAPKGVFSARPTPGL